MLWCLLFKLRHTNTHTHRILRNNKYFICYSLLYSNSTNSNSNKHLNKQTHLLDSLQQFIILIALKFWKIKIIHFKRINALGKILSTSMLHNHHHHHHHQHHHLLNNTFFVLKKFHFFFQFVKKAFLLYFVVVAIVAIAAA